MRVSSVNVNHGNDVMMAQFSFLSSSLSKNLHRKWASKTVNVFSIVKKIDSNFPRSQYSYQP